MPLTGEYGGMTPYAYSKSFKSNFNIYGAMKGHIKNRRNNRRFSARKRRQIGVKSRC